MAEVDIRAAFDMVRLERLHQASQHYSLPPSSAYYMTRSLVAMRASVCIEGSTSRHFALEKSCRSGGAEGPVQFLLTTTPVLEALVQTWHARGLSVPLPHALVQWLTEGVSSVESCDRLALLTWADNILVFSSSLLALHQMAGEVRLALVQLVVEPGPPPLDRLTEIVPEIDFTHTLPVVGATDVESSW